MTTDFRALCAELVEKLDEFDRLLHGAQYVEHPLTYRARAALAENQTRHVYNPAQIAECGGPCEQGPEHCDCGALVMAGTQSKPPTDEELLRTYGLAKRDHCYEGPIDDWPRRADRAATIAGLRAVLARWGA